MSGPSEREAHFLHAQKPLESVLVAPIDAPRALSWMGQSELLLVASADGQVQAVEPAFGTRPLFRAAAEPVHLSTHGDDVYVFAREGAIERWSYARRERIWALRTGLVGNQGLRVTPTEIAAIGDDDSAMREVRVFGLDGVEHARHAVPPRAALGVAADRVFVLARSTAAGLLVVPLGETWRDLSPATAHGLRFTRGGHVLGVAAGGVTVWGGDYTAPRNLRLADAANAALHHDGHTLALGTREGAVAIGDVNASAQKRAHPARVDGHQASVRAMSFSAKGRWLATVADRCRVWSY